MPEETAKPKNHFDPTIKRRRKRKRRKRGPKNHSKNGERFPSVLLPHQRRVLTQPLNYPQPTSPKNPHIRAQNTISNNKLIQTLEALPLAMVKSLYSGLGGQPSRIPNEERLFHLCSRALKQENRMEILIKNLHNRDRQALCIMLQCGGLIHSQDIFKELSLSLGGQPEEWQKTMKLLAKKGLLAKTKEQDGVFFYVLSAPVIPFLVDHLKEELRLPLFTHDDLKELERKEFEPSFHFSLTTLLTYISQRPLKLTQQALIAKSNKDDLDTFFHQIWDSQSEVFNTHIEFLMQHGLVAYKDNGLMVNQDAVEEWLHMSPQDQGRLILAKIEKDFPLVEWLFWVLNESGDKWIAEQPLQALYRRWRRGDEWREIYNSSSWNTSINIKETYPFANLISQGLLDMGFWGSEKFYRLSYRSRSLLKTSNEGDFQQFYLTPSFEIAAPAGLPQDMLYHIGQLAELVRCDRLNSYKITEHSIELALKNGWRREQILTFLRKNSQIGLPENVEDTIKGWIGTQGDLDFFQATVLSVHESQIKKFESSRHYKPFVIHRFVPGLYAIDPSKLDEFKQLLTADGFHTSQSEKEPLPTLKSIKTKSVLQEQLQDAYEAQKELVEMQNILDLDKDEFELIESKDRRRKNKRGLPPRRDPSKIRQICEEAISSGSLLKVVYTTKTKDKIRTTLIPERIAVTAAGQHVLVATDQKTDKRLSYNLIQIERIQAI